MKSICAVWLIFLGLSAKVINQSKVSQLAADIATKSIVFEKAAFFHITWTILYLQLGVLLVALRSKLVSAASTV